MKKKKECREKTNKKQNFHLNVNKRPMKKNKSSQASKREQNRFCKKRLLSQKKNQKTKLSKDFSTSININLENNVAQCHANILKRTFVITIHHTKHQTTPRTPLFYGMPKSLLLDLSFVSNLFVCASVHNKDTFDL